MFLCSFLRVITPTYLIFLINIFVKTQYLNISKALILKISLNLLSKLFSLGNRKFNKYSLTEYSTGEYKMKFINRQNELEKLEEYYKLSQKQLMTVAISGLRRVGKTTLVKEFIKNKKALYFFVYDSKTSAELLREFTEELRHYKIITELETVASWKVFFDILFQRCKNQVLVFDEFQNFYTVDKTVFSILQRACDENKAMALNIVILGSLIGLFKNIFENKKEPLYGRIAGKLHLQPFTLHHSLETLRLLRYTEMEEMLTMYGVLGGFPKYYATMEQFDLQNKNHFEVIEYLFIQDNAPLEAEVATILKQEFGKRSSLYYSILHSIAIGKTKLNEIASAVHMKESSITRHLLELENNFNFIKSLQPIDNRKNTRYYLSHPLIAFWFAFVYDKFSHYSLRDTRQMMSSIKEQFNTFFGWRFEELCHDFLIELNEKQKLPFQLEYLSKWWGAARVDNERQEIEIDIIGLNKKQRKAIFTECKWKENVNPSEILKELKEKSKYVQWHQGGREEYFCLIAKSFIKRIEEKNVLLFDLKDLQKELLR